MDSSLPKLTHNNQILIHPNHAAGNLKISSPERNTERDKKLIRLTAILAVGLLLVVVLFSFFLLPRTKTAMYAANTSQIVDNLVSKTDDVDQALNVLYQSLTASSAGGDQDLSEIKTNVLSANTSAATNFLTANSLLLLRRAEQITTGSSQVLGFSVPETDPNKAVRVQRKLAENIAKKTSASALVLEQGLQNLIDNQVSPENNPLKKQLVLLENQTETYLTEADKTSKYYVTISDAAIEIYNISNSISSVNDIDESVADLTALRSQFANLGQKQLPEESDELNQDIVAVFDLLIGLFKEVKASSVSDPARLLTSYASFITQARGLALQTAVHELNFWQNNPTLSSYQDLTGDYNEVRDQADKVKDDNSYFLLPLLGVN